MQAVIKEVNKLAIYIPCTAHLLNLIGQASVNSCVGAMCFFDFVQCFYNFFSKSTRRWNTLKKRLNKHSVPLPKDQSDTRWSSCVDAVVPLRRGYDHIVSCLEYM